MTITVFSAHLFERPYLLEAVRGRHELHFVDDALTVATAEMAQGSTAVAIFVNDDASAPVLEQLAALGVRYVLVRAAGYDQVDLPAAQRLGLRVANVPKYSPFAIAEHALALMLALNRQLRRADAQAHRADFRLDELVGFDLHGKTVGIIGCGTIGGTMAGLLHGFGCRLLGYDVEPMRLTATVGVRPTEEKLAQSNFNPEEEKDFKGDTATADAKVIRDALGLSVLPLDAEIARQLGMGADIKGLVIDVPGRGTGAQAGLRRGDVIVSATYKALSTAEALSAAIREAKTANRSALLLGIKRRGAATQYATVKLD